MTGSKLAVTSLVLALSAFASVDAAVPDLDADQWRRDLEHLVDHVEAAHPDPWARIDRDAFRGAADDLSRRLAGLEDRQIVVELMRLVARLEDGHSKLLPDGESGFGTWFPIRFYVFDDGIYLTAVSPELAALGGARVEAIGGRPADEVVGMATALFGADNRFGRRQFAFLAASADVLDGLGLLPFGEALPLEVVRLDGRRVEVAVEPVELDEPSLEWSWWGEIFGPLGRQSVSGFGGIPSELIYGTAEGHGMPLHLRARIPYRYEHDPEGSLLYFQIRYLTEESPRAEKSFAATWLDALEVAADGPEPARRLVIDLRFCIGGDGSLVRRFVSELIRRYPLALEPGHVFVLTSGATFSAGVMMAEELVDHVPVVMVGEPMGAPFNAFGDAESVELPESGYTLSISRRWWQLSTSDDERRFIPVQVPAAFTGEQYFGRRDPALDLITAAGIPFESLDAILVSRGGAAAREAFDRDRRRWGHLDSWQPVARMTLDDLADELIAAGRTEDALVALEINTELFPDDWDTWDDLGQLCVELDRGECVRRAYARALELNPANSNADEQRSRLEALERGGL